MWKRDFTQDVLLLGIILLVVVCVFWANAYDRSSSSPSAQRASVALPGDARKTAAAAPKFDPTGPVAHLSRDPVIARIARGTGRTTEEVVAVLNLGVEQLADKGLAVERSALASDIDEAISIAGPGQDLAGVTTICVVWRISQKDVQ